MLTVGVREDGSNIKNKILSGYNCITLCEDEINISVDVMIDNTGVGKGAFECFMYIYNSDVVKKSSICNPKYVISYGLNGIATVTASSITYEGGALSFLYCLQRAIFDARGNKIEPQEFPVRLESLCDIYTALAAITFKLYLNGIKCI